MATKVTSLLMIYPSTLSRALSHQLMLHQERAPWGPAQPLWHRVPFQQDLRVTLIPMSVAGSRTRQTILIGQDIMVLPNQEGLGHQLITAQEEVRTSLCFCKS